MELTRRREGVTLTELILGMTLGAILMLVTIFMVAWFAKMQFYFSQKISDDMEWSTANEHLKKYVHSASYVTISNGGLTMDLYDYGNNKIGSYASANGSLQFSYNGTSMTFKNVSVSSFASLYTDASSGKIIEPAVNYSAPQNVRLCLRCGADVPSASWAKYYAYSAGGGSSLTCVQQTSDGGYIAAGQTYNQTTYPGNYCMYVIKTDSNGKPSWSRVFTNAYCAYSVCELGGGGYVVGGVAGQDACLIKLDASGAPAWAALYASGSIAYSTQVISDGYIMAGSAPAGYAGSSCDVYLAKTNSSGACQWGYSYGGSNYDYVNSVRQVSDGYIMVGGSSSYGGGGYKIYLIKVDSTGAFQWSQILGSFFGESVLQASDGGYVIAAESSQGATQALLLKTDSTGTLKWTQLLSNSVPKSVQPTSDGGYVIASLPSNQSYESLRKTDASGSLVWSQAYKGAATFYAYSAIQTTDGGYVAAGLVGVAACLVKTDQVGACPQASNPVDGGSAPVYSSVSFTYDMTALTHSDAVPN